MPGPSCCGWNVLYRVLVGDASLATLIAAIGQNHTRSVLQQIAVHRVRGAINHRLAPTRFWISTISVGMLWDHEREYKAVADLLAGCRAPRMHLCRVGVTVVAQLPHEMPDRLKMRTHAIDLRSLQSMNLAVQADLASAARVGSRPCNSGPPLPTDSAPATFQHLSNQSDVSEIERHPRHFGLLSR